MTYANFSTITSGTSGISGTSGTSGGGSSSYNVQDISDNTTTGSTTNYYRLSGVTTFYLPVSSGSGDWVQVKNLTNNTSTIYPVSGDKIDGQVLKTMNQFDSYLFIDGKTGEWIS